MKSFGLIGYPLKHSFSKSYFENKFLNENIKGVKYFNLECQDLEELFNSKQLLKLDGFNVTKPHKENIIKYLDELSPEAQVIGAVNCVKNNGGKLVGHNTDYLGFLNSIKPILKTHHKNALILGNGGASKAVVYALKKLNITFKIVSRNSSFDYNDVDKKCIAKHHIIINCTPLGTFPKIDNFPEIRYECLSKNHILYDLVYNPEITLFLSYGKEKNCIVKNGMEMLTIQAEKSWNIWKRKKYTY
ncbi:MAG: shikimate dehydrogenase [Flavobacteriales bacterium]|nr:shikimate dehydrogenase [Flavobacteriales bacterium]|tara:strand:- start:3242 stop:3976 length:735 start_codon:yes stop_codon:yes gene_type:complete